jgi:uncharacterized membrane protein YgdD (TMEM256/DUF423 family)
MAPLFWTRCGASMMFLAVALGAFGAHALKEVLTDDLKAIYETGVRYHVYHALALFVVAWLSRDNPSKAVRAAGWCFFIGIYFFSGSLYALCLTGIRKFGAVTPIGGLLFLAGWALLVFA